MHFFSFLLSCSVKVMVNSYNAKPANSLLHWSRFLASYFLYTSRCRQMVQTKFIKAQLCILCSDVSYMIRLLQKLHTFLPPVSNRNVRCIKISLYFKCSFRAASFNKHAINSVYSTTLTDKQLALFKNLRIGH